MNDRTVTVFGGTGFLGRRVVWHLPHGFSVQIVSRHPDRGTGCSVLIRKFNRSRPTFMTSGQSLMHLRALSVW